MPSEGPKAPIAAASNAAFGIVAWLNTGNALLDDGAFATAALSNVDVSSQYLDVTNFGFSIPNNSIIDGILVEVNRKGTQVTDSIKDTRVRMLDGGVVTSQDKSSAVAWPTVSEYQSYGGASDLWGNFWNPASINASGFGVTIAVTTAGLAETASIDFIRITVYYHLGKSGKIQQSKSLLGIGA